MNNEILYGADARQQIKDGVDRVADAVKVTLGPAGRCVMISYAQPSPQGMLYAPIHVTKDGVTVANSINLIGLPRIGASMAKEAAQRTMDMCGDGTTTTTVLLQSLVQHGMAQIEAGVNPMDLKKTIEESVVRIVAELAKLAIPVGNDIEKIRQVATVSANNDSAIGDLIAEAFAKTGNDGVITIEESPTAETTIKLVDGYQFQRGYISPYFINTKGKAECVLEDVQVLMYDKKITKMAQFSSELEKVFKKALLIICDDMEGEALATLNMACQQRGLPVCVVPCPEFGEKRRIAMDDIAALTGATVIGDMHGNSLEKMTVAMLGHCDKIIVGKESCVLVGGGGNTTDLLNELKMTETEVTGLEQEAIQARIAKLSGGVAVLYVGAATETEMKEKKDRADDAVRATKAAISEGIVPGAGTAYLRAWEEFQCSDAPLGEVMKRAMFAPFEQICANAGVDKNPIMANIFSGSEEDSPNMGYNAKSERVEDLVAQGIIDPCKVLRCALQNAASAAGSILTSEAVVADCV